MTNKHYIIILFTLFLSASAFGQTNYHLYKNQIKFSPFRLIDLSNPGIELSYERKMRDFSAQFSSAYLTELNNDDELRTYKGSKFVLDGKWFFLNHKNRPTQNFKRLQPYVSLELELANIAIKDDVFMGDSNSYQGHYYLDTISIKKTTAAANIKYGFQLTVLKHLVIDISAGLGVRYKKIAHFDKLNDSDKMAPSRHPNIFYISNAEMNGTTINIPLNIKIGYTF